MKMRGKGTILATVAGIVALGVLAGRCAPSAPKGAKKGAAVSDIAAAAMKIYVAPGDLDEYYLFSSGGHSGQVYVYGIPSMRHIVDDPGVHALPGARATASTTSRRRCWATSPGATCTTPPCLKRAATTTARWLFVNDMNDRMARIDLRDFKTKQILGPIPNVSGNHGSAFVTPNTEYSIMASRFSIPIPKGPWPGVDKYATEYKGVVTGIKVDPKTGEMSLGWQIMMPPFDYDLGDAGKGRPTAGCSGPATTASGRPASSRSPPAQRDRDYIAAVDWKLAEKAAAEGKGTMIGGIKVLDPKDIPGLVYLMPAASRPHGVDVSSRRK